MPDPVTPVETPPTPTPPPAPTTPPTPAVEAVDDQGVPWKNRAAELNRKLEEERQRNLEYQIALGRQNQQQAATSQTTDGYVDGKYRVDIGGIPYELDRPTLEFFRKIAKEEANQTAYQFVGRARMQQEASDPEVQNEARAIYQNEILTDPYYSDVKDDARQALAIKEAQVRILKRKQQAASQQSASQTLQAAASAQAQAASLPPTQPGASSGTDKETYIREFIADPVQRAYVKSMHKLDPDSPEGQAKLKAVAEYAWKGSPVSEKFAQAVELLKRST